MINKFSWVDSNEYPFQSHYITQNNVQQHYIEIGTGDVLLFVHGTPSWSFDFRNVIQKLSKNYRCVAIDHIGFGLSDKPENYDYSLPSHVKNLTNFIEQKKLTNITIVVHDFGGPIGFEYALNHPENVKRIVVLNTWLGSSENNPEFKKMRRILKSPLLPFLYLRLNFSASYLLPSSFGLKKPSKEIKKHFTKPFSKKSERYGTLGFAKSLLNDQAFFETQLRRFEKISKKPFLLVWGMKDKFVGRGYFAKFKNLLPHAMTLEIESAGHFPQEEEPELVSKAIVDFLNQTKS